MRPHNTGSGSGMANRALTGCQSAPLSNFETVAAPRCAHKTGIRLPMVTYPHRSLGPADRGNHGLALALCRCGSHGGRAPWEPHRSHSGETLLRRRNRA
jgi:hypothetical protein